MDNLMICKVLSNETRQQILQWLKDPEQNFAHQPKDGDFEGGVCVGSIREKAGLAQSVVSSYLDMMQKAGLLESKRIGKWTYYRRNEQVIQAFAKYIKEEL